MSMTDFNDDWNIRFLGLAEHISTWSKDPSTKVGAIITDNEKRVISMGYNGLPQSIEDSDEILNDREKKYNVILHAEENAILFSKTNLSGYHIFTHPLAPCSRCTAKIIQTGIKYVVSTYSNNPRWLANLEFSAKLLYEAGISYKVYDGSELYFWNELNV